MFVCNFIVGVFDKLIILDVWEVLVDCVCFEVVVCFFLVDEVFFDDFGLFNKLVNNFCFEVCCDCNEGIVVFWDCKIGFFWVFVVFCGILVEGVGVMRFWVVVVVMVLVFVIVLVVGIFNNDDDEVEILVVVDKVVVVFEVRYKGILVL